MDKQLQTRWRQTEAELRDQEQQAASIAHEREITLRELRKQAESQPELLKTQWKHQMFQQTSYRAEIHEFYTEMLNMREKPEMQAALSAEMQAALSAKMRRLELPNTKANGIYSVAHRR